MALKDCIFGFFFLCVVLLLLLWRGCFFVSLVPLSIVVGCFACCVLIHEVALKPLNNIVTTFLRLDSISLQSGNVFNQIADSGRLWCWKDKLANQIP